MLFDAILIVLGFLSSAIGFFSVYNILLDAHEETMTNLVASVLWGGVTLLLTIRMIVLLG